MLGQLLAVCNLRSENVVSDAVWVGHSIVCVYLAGYTANGGRWLLPQQHGDYSYSDIVRVAAVASRWGKYRLVDLTGTSLLCRFMQRPRHRAGDKTCLSR